MGYLREAFNSLNESKMRDDDIDMVEGMVSSLQTINWFKGENELYSDDEWDELHRIIDEYKELIRGKNTHELFKWEESDVDKKNRLELNLERYIDSLHDKYSDYVNYTDSKVTWQTFPRYFNHYIKPLSDEEIISICKIELSDDMGKDCPMFLLKSGKFINLTKQRDELSSKMHSEFFYKMCDIILKYKIGEGYVNDFYDDSVFNQLDWITTNRGWARLNPITPGYEPKFYCVLPNKSQMTQGIYDGLLKFLDLGETKANKVSIYATDSFDYKEYFFDDNTPDEILRKIRYYYSSGYFRESTKSAIGASISKLRYKLLREQEMKRSEPKNIEISHLSESVELPNEDEVLKAMELMSDEDDLPYIDSDATYNNAPVTLITPKGEILNACEYDTHEEFMRGLFKDYLTDSLYGDGDFALNYVQQKLHFITLNTGSGYGDDRCKIVIDFDVPPTQRQYDIMKEWLDRRFENGEYEVIVFCKDSQKSFYLKEQYPEYIIKSIRRCFTSGILEKNKC